MRRRRTLVDAVKRGSGATFLFVALWLAIGWTSGLQVASPLVYWANVAAFLGFGLARYGVRLATPALASASLPMAETAFASVVLANALHWGALTAATAAWPPLQIAWLPLYLTSVGIAGAGSINLSILKPLRMAYALCVLGPLLLVLIWLDVRQHVFEIVALALYLGYVGHVSKINHDDYHSAASAREELEQRARQLEQLSTTDALTGIANRHLFDHRLAAEWARAAREGMSLSLLLIDVDHFKRVNDSFGHPVGDRCLVAVAQALSTSLGRSTDLLARYGGEEFAALLPGAGAEDARRVGEMLRRSVEAVALEHGGVRIPIAVSVGVSTATPSPRTSAMHALQRADTALYTAKREGRNRVVLAEEVPA